MTGEVANGRTLASLSAPFSSFSVPFSEHRDGHVATRLSAFFSLTAARARKYKRQLLPVDLGTLGKLQFLVRVVVG